MDMIFEVNKEEFVRAIKPSVEVATKNTLKEFKYENLVTIKATQDKLALFAYGGAASIISPISDSNFAEIDYKCEAEGNVTVYADDLFTFVSSTPYEKIRIELVSSELKISSASKKAKSKKKSSTRSMPTVSEIVKPPNLGEEFSQEIEINREIFIKGIDSVLFAPAYEEKMYTYMCMLFEAIEGTEQEVRFSAGTGGRFAVKSTKGKNIVTNHQNAKIIFPKVNLPTISKLLSEVADSTVTIKCVNVNSKDNIPEQIMVEFNEMVLCLFGIESFTKYPDLTKVINYKYPNRVYSNLEDWDCIVKTIEGTKHRYNEDIHNTEVVLNEENEVFKVTPKTAHTSSTFIDIADVEECVVKGEDIWFCCNSQYIDEMVAQGNRKGRVQLNFESQSILSDIPDDKPKQMRPVLVKFPKKVDEAKDTSDNFYMFFTVSTK